MFDLLYNPITISGDNIDPRYFKDNGDGTYSATPLFRYNVARDLVKFTKNKIFDLDTKLEYHTESVREVKDTWSEKLHEDQWRAKYGELTKEATKRWHQYRDEHPMEFETRGKRIDIGGEDEARFFAGYSPDIKPSLIESILLYNAANIVLEKFNKPDGINPAGPDYDSLPFEEPLYSKAEFANAHKAVRARISEQLGIPNDTFEVGKIEKTVCRINNSRCMSLGPTEKDDVISEFISGLIKYITSSNAVEFNKKRLECVTLIDKDFSITFNDTAKNLKAESGPNESIIIYTKTDENSSPIKLITIGKDEPDSNYKYMFSAEHSGEKLIFSKDISTKADLRKALSNTINMIEDIDEFKKYVPDIEHTLETL